MKRKIKIKICASVPMPVQRSKKNKTQSPIGTHYAYIQHAKIVMHIHSEAKV